MIAATNGDRAPAADLGKNLKDPEFRNRLRRQDADALAAIGYSPAPGASAEVKVVTSTRDISYVPMPPKPWAEDRPLGATQLEQLNAAGSVGSASSAGSTSTFGCANGTASSLSTAATAGTAGSNEV